MLTRPRLQSGGGRRKDRAVRLQAAQAFTLAYTVTDAADVTASTCSLFSAIAAHDHSGTLAENRAMLNLW
jgi:hypothetical protein